jgi:hypothetical protein
MKTTIDNTKKGSNKNNIVFEILNEREMLNIRGGNTTEKLKTKEMDVYDTREY